MVSQSPDHANVLLADIASHYLANLAQTVANYPKHAGHHTMSAGDTIRPGIWAVHYATHSNNLHGIGIDLLFG
ncbi:hypothetical protein V8D89_002639 [Ganoderma adspersum]